MEEIRYYKGLYKVQIILKSKGNYRVKALEDVLIKDTIEELKHTRTIKKGETFVTVPRLLWRKPKRCL